MWIARELYFKVVYVRHTANVECSTYLAVGSDGVVSMDGLATASCCLRSYFLFASCSTPFYIRWHQEASSESDAHT